MILYLMYKWYIFNDDTTNTIHNNYKMINNINEGKKIYKTQ